MLFEMEVYYDLHQIMKVKLILKDLLLNQFENFHMKQVVELLTKEKTK